MATFKFHTQKETRGQRYYLKNSEKKKEKRRQRQLEESQLKEQELQRREQEQEQEHQRRLDQEQEQELQRQLQERTRIAHILVSIRTVILKSLFDEIEQDLHEVPLKTCYRKFIKMAWSFHLGYTTNAIGGNCFKTPHPIQIPPWRALGVDVRSPLIKEHPQYQKELFLKATAVMQIVDPDFVRNQYVVHFAKMSSSNHSVPVHTDDRDIGPQYIIHFGEWKGAELRTYNTLKEERTNSYYSFSTPRQVIYIDSRMAHEVVKQNFKGVRFTMIVYHLWREDQFAPSPYLFPPLVCN
jgi:hypothetical protein